MIRLLIISNYCSQSKEGKSSVTARLEKVLALYCNSELKTAIAYNSKDQKDPFNKDGIDYYPISSDMFPGDIFKKWDDAKEELKTVIVQFKPDIIYCFGTEMPYSAISQETDLPVVVHMLGNLNIYTMMLDSVRHFSAENDINQDLTYVNQEAIKTTEKNNRKSKRIETFTNAFELEVLRSTPYFFVRTLWDRNIVRHYAPQAKYYFVNEPMQPEFYEAAGTWKYKERKKIRLLCISSADYRKGNEIILRTALLLKELVRLDFEWYVAGSRDYFSYFENITGIRHEDVNIKLLGMIKPEEIVEELKKADFFIHPSIIDNSPNSIVEAQLIGCPVIASNVGGVPDLVKDKISGFLYPYNEPHTLAFLIDDLHKEKEKLIRISENEVQIALKRNDPKTIAETTVNYLKEIIRDHNSTTVIENDVKMYNSSMEIQAVSDDAKLNTEESALSDTVNLRDQKYRKTILDLNQTIRNETRKNHLYERRIEELEERIIDLKTQNRYEKKTYDALMDSTFWRMTEKLRKVTDRLKRNPLMYQLIAGMRKTIRGEKREKYGSFISYLYHCFPDTDFLKQQSTVFAKRITFSIIVPLYNTNRNFLIEMIESVQAQTYPGWQLCLSDGSDRKHNYVGRICRKYANKDQRIVYKKLERNLGISGNSNEALKLAKGEYISLLDHDDVLHPSALYEIMRAICEKDADFIYTDECTFRSPELKEIEMAIYKSDFAFDDLLANNYICHFTTFSKTLLDKTEGFRSEYDGSQDHDLFLRLTSLSRNIIHIPELLYYWRSYYGSTAMAADEKNYASEAGRKAVQDFLDNAGLEAEVEALDFAPSVYHVSYALKGKPKISIIILSNDHAAELDACIYSIEKSSYHNYEILVVENNSQEEETFLRYETLLKRYENIRILNYSGKSNDSQIKNSAVEQCTGEYIVLLSSSTTVITAKWLEEMLSYAQRKDVGAIGAMLYYPDDTICHAGFVLSERGGVLDAFKNRRRGEVGYMDKLSFARDVAAVSGACMMLRKEVWEAVKGFDENFVSALNDVDLCLRLRKKGYKIVWTPFAQLYLNDSENREDKTVEKSMVFEYDKDFFMKRWLYENDPYYNTNLSASASFIPKEEFK